ncbi:MAG: hypothetical protein AAGA90_02300 [Actinomycetota bacterium]
MSDTATEATASKPDERLAYRGVFQRAFIRPEIGAALGAVFIWVFFWAVSVSFGNASGAQRILDQAASPLGIMAVAVALLMIGGEFDLSSGAATGALAILTVLLVRDVNGLLAGAGYSLWVALPISLAAALALGWWNGFLVNRTSLPSFIVTLGSFFVLRGAKPGFAKLIVDQIEVGKLDDLQIYADETKEYQAALADLEDQIGADAVEELRASGDLADTLELGGSFSTNIVETGGNTSDKGYGLLRDIFAGEWTRNDHIWESRDWVYSIGIIAGLCLVILAVYEFHFRRRDTLNPAGLGTFLGGVAIGVAGVWRLHDTDGTTDNLTAAIIIGLGMLVATSGWCLWRYAPRPAELDDTHVMVDGRTLSLAAIGGVVVVTIIRMLRFGDLDAYLGDDWYFVVTPIFRFFRDFPFADYASDDHYFLLAALLAVVTLAVLRSLRITAPAGAGGGYTASLILGFAGLLGAIIVARWLDSGNAEDLTVAFDWLSGRWALVLALLAALVAAALSVRADLTSGFEPLDLFLGETRTKVVSAIIVASLATIGFINLATEQGARAILFMVLASMAAVGIVSAATNARRVNAGLATLLLLVTSLSITLMAFFVRAESTSAKFRAQAFAVMLIIAAVIAIWGLANARFEARRFPDVSADRLARNIMLVSVAFILVGVIARLLWVTQAELDAGLNTTKFSVRILWFVGFTAIVSWVLARTRFGSWTFAVGGNKDAARQVGVPAARTKTQLFMVVSAAAWLVGMLLAFRLNTIQASTGDGQEFLYIIAAVVGGTALTGGYGSTMGAGIGAVIMAMAIQGIPSARWNSDWRFVFLGAILLLSVVANNYIRTKAESARS